MFKNYQLNDKRYFFDYNLTKTVSTTSNPKKKERLPALFIKQ